MNDHGMRTLRAAAYCFLLSFAAVAIVGCAASSSYDVPGENRALHGCVEEVSSREMHVIREGSECLEVYTRVFECPNGVIPKRVLVRDEIPVRCANGR
jgi:hypothetical protein